MADEKGERIKKITELLSKHLNQKIDGFLLFAIEKNHTQIIGKLDKIQHLKVADAINSNKALTTAIKLVSTGWEGTTANENCEECPDKKDCKGYKEKEEERPTRGVS